MVIIEKVNVDDIPLLVITKKDDIHKPLPTLIYYHGFRSGKENNLTLAYLLAEQNLRVILPESQFHGERFVDVTNKERELAFWDIIIQTINELDQIKTYLDEHNLVLDDRVAVAGTSMGGMVTAGSLVKYDWITSAGLLMSTGKLSSFATSLINHINQNNDYQISVSEQERVLTEVSQYDLEKHINKLQDRPLFIWHGKDDDVVPFEHAEQLFEQIKMNGQSKKNIKFVEEKNRSHHLSRLAISEATRFFTHFL